MQLKYYLSQEVAVYKKIANKVAKLIQVAGLKKKYYRTPKEMEHFFFSLAVIRPSVTLDIGSGPEPKNPFNADKVYGADLRENKEKGVVFSDFSSGYLPFANDSFDYITAYDVLEHIQRVSIVNGVTHFPFIQLINEIFRVLKPNGIFFNSQPCFPSKEAFQDPTHVNIMTEDTLYLYFCKPAWARIYGFEGSFEMINDGWVRGSYFSFMKKSFNHPIKNLGFIQK
ncbi:methyltransferase domain-containing protein [Methylovulum miyakonense]|uniref:methyltransferase domain-containing protein n=1 Tax=Methylovulum miyakonense TaxID=645578 RepID=UPI00037FEE79|nr:methyltransferase domain-containing protein [Methylovulum miyakonense]